MAIATRFLSVFSRTKAISQIFENVTIVIVIVIITISIVSETDPSRWQTMRSWPKQLQQTQRWRKGWHMWRWHSRWRRSQRRRLCKQNQRRLGLFSSENSLRAALVSLTPDTSQTGGQNIVLIPFLKGYVIWSWLILGLPELIKDKLCPGYKFWIENFRKDSLLIHQWLHLNVCTKSYY